MKRVNRSLFLILCLQFIVIVAVNAQGTRNYYTNRALTGQTEDTQGPNYLLLHEMYVATPAVDHYVLGKITAIRGSSGSWNRKWTVEVNTSSAYTTNRGSVISYNEPTYLVTLTYNNIKYLALFIANSSAMYNFSFTGYAQGETLLLVHDENVSGVTPFVSTLDPIMIQGNVGIGTTYTGTHKLSVEGSIGAQRVKVTPNGWSDFVFEPDYQLPSLSELERYIKNNHHLPEIPSADEVKKEGIDIGEMNKKLLQKVEELTLYIIQQQQEITELKGRMKVLEDGR